MIKLLLNFYFVLLELRIKKRKKYHFQEIYGNVSFYSNYWLNLKKSNEEKKKEISNILSDI